jgi:hypothetical protein
MSRIRVRASCWIHWGIAAVFFRSSRCVIRRHFCYFLCVLKEPIGWHHHGCLDLIRIISGDGGMEATSAANCQEASTIASLARNHWREQKQHYRRKHHRVCRSASRAESRWVF